MQKLIVGNWKMNGTSADIPAIGKIVQAAGGHKSVDSGLCLPATLIERAASEFPGFAIGGQDCHAAEKGAHTGCVSAGMLKDAGAGMVIVGHSERRSDQGESDADVQGKARAARGAGLDVIICVGETEAERDAGKAEDIVLGQIDASVPDDLGTGGLAIAYEPVWAIGTGRVPSGGDVAAMHDAIRKRLIERLGQGGTQVRILYGGSMNGGNAAELLAIPNVDGGLIGGASLSADKFEPILAAAARP